MRVRRKKAAEQAPAIPLEWTPSAGTLPPVLTPLAVTKGAMPPLGQSGMPASLEAGVPPEFRFWTAKTAEEACAVRDELVERAIVRACDVLMVDGEPRLIEWRAFLVEHEGTAELAKRSTAGAIAALRLSADAEPVRVVDAVDDETAWTSERFASTIADVGKPVVFALKAAAREAAIAAGLTAFSLATRPGVVFATTSTLDPDAEHVSDVSDRSDTATAELTKRAFSHPIRLIKADGDAATTDTGTEERFVLGVVLEPDEIDTQSDTYSEDEVRKAAHRYMENFGQLGTQHTDIVTGRLKILESYVAPVAFAVGDQQVKKGTWLLGIRAVDDGLWNAIKSGEYTGLSIGGTALRTPENAAPAPTPAPAS